jgi:hypothetical protein
MKNKSDLGELRFPRLISAWPSPERRSDSAYQDAPRRSTRKRSSEFCVTVRPRGTKLPSHRWFNARESEGSCEADDIQELTGSAGAGGLMELIGRCTADARVASRTRTSPWTAPSCSPSQAEHPRRLSIHILRCSPRRTANLPRSLGSVMDVS